MKKIILSLALALAILNVYSQESMITLGGGYSFATIKDYDDPASGFRINGLYEFNLNSGMVAHGLAVGYSNISATKTISNGKLTTTVSTVPVYYAPKIMFGGEKAKAFVKGAVGMQFASLKREGVVSLTDSDAGFYGGGGAGGMLFITETIFINAKRSRCFGSMLA